MYAFCALGLAGFVPRPRASGHPWLGARLFTGFSLIPVFLFLVHIIAGVGLLAASYALVVLSALGLIRLVAGWVRVPDARPPRGRDKNARKRRFPGQWALTFML